MADWISYRSDCCFWRYVVSWSLMGGRKIDCAIVMMLCLS